MTFQAHSPCFLPQAGYFVLGTWLPKQGREDIHIFPTPFFSLVDISRCASSRLAKHKQAFRLTGSWTRRSPTLRSSPASGCPSPPHRPAPTASKYPSPKGICWWIDFFFPFSFFPPCCPLTDACKCLCCGAAAEAHLLLPDKHANPLSCALG